MRPVNAGPGSGLALSWVNSIGRKKGRRRGMVPGALWGREPGLPGASLGGWPQPSQNPTQGA